MTFWYLASPYSKYPGGMQAAYEVACAAQARLIGAGIPVFSPIAHTHGAAIIGGIDPADHDVWIPADRPFMRLACGVIVLTADGWERSKGVQIERDFFTALCKPTVYMQPGHVPNELREQHNAR